MKLICYKYFIISVLFSTPILAQEGVVHINKSAEIDRVLALKKELNKEQDYIKIQIFNGNRLDAEAALVEFKTEFPDHFVEMKYETPNYKIWVGKFRTRLEADRELLAVKKLFPNAFPFKP
ncbi:MAG: Uncharacterised protein [Formosa sp. Hel1_33_131]|jgi:hypothetical protein|nr:SPOR domain-containing protein [Flavobacteriaceae bacterium]CAI8186717.1 MAG: Uncharacterised protein [Formosa sp. Hel1_33_131]|tara:strand:+ start:1520 stop:1882 length:363 start_codon:yes stop_codon:yes gene_type:complete